MKNIHLTKNKIAIVDDDNFDQLNQWKWHYSDGYARRRSGGRKNGKQIYMHREILQLVDGHEVDHVYRNKLNNQKYNLRLVTRSENSINKDLLKSNKSGYKGIHWDAQRKKWFVQICRNNKHTALGRFDCLNKAIEVRREAEKNMMEILNEILGN